MGQHHLSDANKSVIIIQSGGSYGRKNSLHFATREDRIEIENSIEL